MESPSSFFLCGLCCFYCSCIYLLKYIDHRALPMTTEHCQNHKKCLPMGDCVPASRWADTDEADGVRLGGMIMVPVWLHELVLLPSCNNSVNIRYKVCYLYAYWNIHMYSIRNLYYNTLIDKNKEVCKWRNLPRSSYFTGDRLKKLCQFSKYTLDNLEKSICSTTNRCNEII